MKNKKKNKSKLFSFSLPILASIIFTLFGFSIFIYSIFNVYDSQLNKIKTSINQAYQDNVWVTLNSNRAKFSFKHPLSWPVSQANEDQLNNINTFDDGTETVIDYIDFEKEFDWQAGGLSNGYVVIKKTKYQKLSEYVNELSKPVISDMLIKGELQKVTSYPPKIEYLKIGNIDAISVTETNNFPSFTYTVSDYRLIKNGWLYRFSTLNSTRFMQSEKKNTQKFKQIISTVKFSD